MDLSPISEPTSWERRTKMEKRLIVALILSVVISMALMFALIFARPIIIIAQTTTNAPQDDVCITAGCIKAAGQILERMDASVNPCDNFYNFVCGNYIKSNVVPPDKDNVTTLALIHDKIQKRLREAIEAPIQNNETGTTALIKKYYRACMNTTSIKKNGLQALQTLLNQIGGWPVVDGDTWNEDEFDWTKLMYKFRELGLHSDMFLAVTIGPDLKNSNQHMIYLKGPNYGISPEHLIKGTKHSFVTAYYNYMINVAVLLGADKEKATNELKQSLEFEMQLANFSLSEVETREAQDLHNAKSIAEMRDDYPNIPWLEYIRQIVANDIHIKSSEVVLVTTPLYVSAFQKFISDTSKRVLANYAIWRNIQQLIPFLTEELREEKLRFKSATEGISEKLPRWEQCINEARLRLPILAGSLYVQNYFTKNSKKSVSEIVKYIRQAFKDILENADWMDLETQRTALDKSAAVKERIGYPDELLDRKRITDMYKEVEIYEDQYLQSYLNLKHWESNFHYRKLRTPTNSTNWILNANPATATARYYPTSNSIVFSAGILQGLLFNSDRPYYMNFGAIGSIIGRELTHGFDYSGRTIDKNGMASDWWAPKTKQLFLKNAECIIHQYENYTVSELGKHLNGKKTRNENIADNGGVKQAYLAYKAWKEFNNPELKLPGLDYSPKQLFWISYAMQLCSVYKQEILKTVVANGAELPNEFRVVGPLSNSKYFSEDFNCKLHTKMNPVNKCSVW